LIERRGNKSLTLQVRLRHSPPKLSDTLNKTNTASKHSSN